MSVISDFRIGGKRIIALSWEEMLMAIRALKSTPSTTIFLGSPNAQMTLEFVEGFGYYISAFGEGEVEEWLAVDTKLADTFVSVMIGGQIEKMPRRIFVQHAIAEDVVAYFYSFGRRSPQHVWIRSLDLMH